MEYLSVKVKVPHNLEESIKNEIYENITSLPYEELSLAIENSFDMIIYYFNIFDINLASYIEEKFDNYINLNVKYSYLLYELGKKYPSSIRINKRGKKIFTKKQTKIIGI
tara:strand:+ start:107 stop:436 length:330 start_codon:yes stop_codon:yes gene_type:complete